MSTIQRPLKSGMTRSYVEEVSLGFDVILDTEIDHDLSTIYDDYNGGINNDNISENPPFITYNKLNLNKSIKPSDLQDGFVFPPTASIPGSTIQPNTITSLQIQDGTIDTIDLHDGAVTRDKLAPNARISTAAITFAPSQVNSGTGEHPVNVTVAGTPVPTFSFTSLGVSRFTRITVDWAATVSVTAAATLNSHVIIRVKIDGTEVTKRIWGIGMVGNTFVPGPTAIFYLAAGTHTVGLTVEFVAPPPSVAYFLLGTSGFGTYPGGTGGILIEEFA